MSQPNTSEKSNDLDRQENLTRGQLSAKKVALYSYDSTTDTLKPVGDSAITIQDLYNQLALTLERLEYGNITDKTKTLRVQLNPDLAHTISIAAAQTLATVTTVGTVSNTSRQGDLQMQRVNEAILDTAFQVGIINNVAF